MKLEIVNNEIIVPLKEVSITGEMIDFFGKINTKLVFENPTTDAAEVIYQFTLDPSSIITSFTAQIKDKKLIGVVTEKNKARHIYKSATKNKQTSSLLEKDNNGRYRVTLGNIQVGDVIVIEYSYFVKTITENGKQKLVIPTNIGEKYDPYGSTNSRTYSGSIIQMVHHTSVPYNFYINIDWKSSSLIKSVTSTGQSQPNIVKRSDNLYNITTTALPSDGDFVVHAECEISNNVYSNVSSFDNAMYSVLITQIPDELEDMLPKEFIFFLDKSGSMEGDRIVQAKKALKIYLRSLPVGSKFNVVAFDDEYFSIFTESVEYNERNLKLCLTELDKINASGGTEMYKCLYVTLNNQLTKNDSKIKNTTNFITDGMTGVMGHIFGSDIEQEKLSADAERICVLLTDGDIGDVENVVKLVDSFKTTTRFFTIGLGNSVDRELVNKIAEATGGLSRIVIDEKIIDDIIIDMTTHVYKTHYTDVEVSFGDVLVKYPKKMYPNNFVTVFSKQDPSNSVTEVIIRGTNCTTKEKKVWTISVNNTVSPNQDLLRIMYVDDQISNVCNGLSSEEIIDLSIRHTLMNKYTSFILVDEVINDQKDVLTIQVPQSSRRDEMMEGMCLCGAGAPRSYNKSGIFSGLSSNVTNIFESVGNIFFSTSSKQSDLFESENTEERFVKNQKIDGHFEMNQNNLAVMTETFDVDKILEFSKSNKLTELIVFNMLAMMYLTNKQKPSYLLLIRKLRSWIKTNANLSEAEIDSFVKTLEVEFKK